MDEELTRSLISLREVKALREVLKGKQTRLRTQPEDMDEQYGSSYTTVYEKYWKVKGV